MKWLETRLSCTTDHGAVALYARPLGAGRFEVLLPSISPDLLNAGRFDVWQVEIATTFVQSTDPTASLIVVDPMPKRVETVERAAIDIESTTMGSDGSGHAVLRLVPADA